MKKLLLSVSLGAGLVTSYASAAPFEECPTQAFLMQDRVAKLYSVDLATGYYETLAGDLDTNERINGVGFNMHDSYLYGWGYEQRTVVRIGDDFDAEFLGPVQNIPANSSFYVGDVSVAENAYYVYRKSSTHGLYKIPLDPADPNYLVATKIIDGANLELRIYDFAFHPTNGYLYSVDRNGLLLKIDANAGTYEVLATLSTTGTFGAVYFDADGMLYYSRNADGHIFRVDPEAVTPSPVTFAYGPKSSQNDGARCALAPAISPTAVTIDFGDAPDSYGTYFASNGARHETSGSFLRLGATVDGEEDAYVFPESDDAVGESGFDDGIQFVSSIKAGESLIYKVSSTGSGVLNAFFDWNGDGDFDDAGESTGDVAVSNGDQLLTVNVPIDAVAGDTWSRFRLTSAGGVGATGGASDGEVEDYPIEVLPCNCSVISYPSGGDSVTLAYEDLWPSKGDYDMNDLVLYYRTEALKTTSDIHSVRIEGEIVAVGATFHNGFAVRLPGVAASNIDTANITYKINDIPVSRDPLESGRSEAIIVVTEDVWDEITPTDTCGFYRTQLPCDEPISWSFSINVPFINQVADSTFDTLRFDPFLFGTNGYDRNADYNPTNGRDLEVHLKNVSNTEAADTSFLGRAWDASVAAEGLYYQADNGIPFALEIGTEWQHPLEGVDIIEAYPDFINYVLSGGETHTDWYLLENADQSKIYPF